MALQHAILVSLAERAASGYDLARRFDASIGQFWKASHQQIYKVLAQMETDGLICASHVAQTGKPDKKVYAITDAGRTELNDFTTTTTAPEILRSELAVKVRALPFGDRDAITDSIRTRLAHHRDRLAAYEASAARFYPEPDAIDDEQLGGYLVLRGGILGERTGVAWCTKMLQALESVDTESSEAGSG